MRLIDDRDRVALVLFNDKVPIIPDPRPMASARSALIDTIGGVFAQGGTALYDAIGAAHAKLDDAARAQPKRMHAMVVLSDGRDEHSKLPLWELTPKISPSAETATAVRLFTIAYGPKADPKVLSDIAEAGGGASFKGDANTIRQIYQDLAAFF